MLFSILKMLLITLVTWLRGIKIHKFSSKKLLHWKEVTINIILIDSSK